MKLSDEASNKPINEKVETEFDDLMLDRNISIKENYSRIQSLLSLHKENNYAEYSIIVYGHYVYGKHASYEHPVGILFVKAKDFPYTLSEQIIDILTRLYTRSLGKKFKVQDEWSECTIVTKVNHRYFYRLLLDSPLYKKIHDKVVEEINQINNV
jgi:hypothetical protein